MIQEFIRGNPKDSTILWLLSQWDNVEIKESKLSVVPTVCWVLFHFSVKTGNTWLFKEIMIPFVADMSTLHGVNDVTGLNDMLNCNCGFALWRPAMGTSSFARCALDTPT